MNDCEILRAALQLHYVYECEPAEVNEYGYRRFPIWLYVRELVLHADCSRRADSETSPFPIELKEIRERLLVC